MIRKNPSPCHKICRVFLIIYTWINGGTYLNGFNGWVVLQMVRAALTFPMRSGEVTFCRFLVEIYRMTTLYVTSIKLM